jgi:fatty acid desaturase
MSKGVEKKQKSRWRGRTWLLILGAGTIVSGLLYWEQLAWLYVLGTLAVTVLLLVVAFADLGEEEEMSQASSEGNEPAGARESMMTGAATTQTASAGKRSKAR